MNEESELGRGGSFDSSSHELDRGRQGDHKRGDHQAFPTPGQMNCSICGTGFSPQESSFMPFCGKRCQQIDLGRWLGEAYGLPIEGHEEREFGGLDDDSDGGD